MSAIIALLVLSHCPAIFAQAPKLLWSGDASVARSSSVAAFDVCVWSSANGVQRSWKPPHQQWLARVNVGSAADADVRAKATARHQPIIMSLKGEGDARLDVEDAGWQTFVRQEVLEPLLAQGFDGWVLDGLDRISAKRIALLATEVIASNPGRQVLLANQFDTATSVPGSGICVEGTLESLDAQLPQVTAATKRGAMVLATAYSTSAAGDRNRAWAAKWASAGALPFVTTEERPGLALAPLLERPRRVLVLHGWDAKASGRPAMIPADTMTAELLQAPIEWLGYECDYANVASDVMPADVAARYAAVIVDGETDVPLLREHEVAQWLADARRATVPVFFLGGIPFTSDDAVRMLRDAFGLRGSLQVQSHVTDIAFNVISDSRLNFEAKIAPRQLGFRDLQAPDDAEVLVNATALDAEHHSVQCTPIFFASWGGAWLEPYVVLRASQDSNLLYADPYAMMAALLQRRGAVPSPDTTTRDGRRIFYSHIDGDGFAAPSQFKGHPLCGEVIRDRILKVFPIPVTVSVVEADMRALAEGVEDELQPRITQAAREIFAMPNVQPASHSFSHPYLWHKDDPNPGEYDEPNMPLKPGANYPDISMDREIRGSIGYINKELCPQDKPVQLMLWSGNCRPGAEALRVCRELGVENMNGGDTVISRLYPGVAGIAPRVTLWDGELQINAANQNEFMYANGWMGPFYGGFARVTDTFERTESPRRVKPVNVYYHFYSATNLSSVRALESIHRWCAEHDLHPVTAMQFAQMTRDAFRTRVFETGSRQWLLVNDGHLRTYRLPASLGIPDLAKCSGVTGWMTLQDSLYVHTSGQPRTQLVLRDAVAEPMAGADAHLHLKSSNAEITFDELAGRHAVFQTQAYQPSVVELGGLPAKGSIQVTVNGTMRTVVSDPHGRLTLQLPTSARVIVDATQARYANAEP